MKYIHTFESFLNENLNEKSGEFIVFLPIAKKDIVDIDDSTFGAYGDAEYDKIAPFNKAKDYTTSLSFPDLKTAKEYADLVRAAKGDMKSADFKKADEFEQKNKIKK
jgi:hypothetical protein